MLAVLLLVGAAVGVTWFLMREPATEPAAGSSSYGAPGTSSPSTGDRTAGETEPAESSAPTTSAAPPTSAAPTPTPTLTPEEQALAELERLRAESLTRLRLDGRWVAQVASKAVGITDPLQVADNGTNTFYAADILVESRLAVESASGPSAVYVLKSIDFGKRSYWSDGQPFWVTLVDEGFASSDAVDAWCEQTFWNLTPEQLANACAPRTLAPPHD